MVIDDMQRDNSEMKTVYPPRVLREWLEYNSISGFYENLKRKVWGQDEELKKAATMTTKKSRIKSQSKRSQQFKSCIQKIYSNNEWKI